MMLFFALAAAAGRFQFAIPGYHFEFPRDYFSHPSFQVEWWYYSGNLATPEGRNFGFELALFRLGVAPLATRDSLWQVDDIYMAHVALSDLGRRRFFYRERVNRGGPGMAGISRTGQRIWNGNWQVQWRGGNQQLHAVTDTFSLELLLRPSKPPVLNGHHGFSQKAPGIGNASNYFSLTRLETTGTVTLAGERYEVSGSSWMDHEFSTTPKNSPVAGWDWFAIQLDNDTEIMLYRVRLKSGTFNPCSSGTWTDTRGNGHYLDVRDFVLTPGQKWTSPRTHARYPIQWQIAIPSLRVQLKATTPVDDQELVGDNSASPTYWEGAIRINGQEAGKAVTGVGYLEMTGYAKPLNSGAN